MQSFAEKISSYGFACKRAESKILQVNLGKLCNQACSHCHVDASPVRSEIMEQRTIQRILELLAFSPQIKTVDLTGGAPEMNPHFRHFVAELKLMGKEVIDRCNLTILREPGQEDMAQFLADHYVHVISSLPCYREENVDQQRGPGVFQKSLEALKQLNDLGYGKGDLKLDLVYNPLGPNLSPNQRELEESYQNYLLENYGIYFDHLLTITNMPIARFAQSLARTNQLKEYYHLLHDHFNPDAFHHVMCKELISISWDGNVYDCDFNQMLDLLPVRGMSSLWDLESFQELDGQDIAVANHCYACTAGQGSSCSGALS